MPSEKKYTIGEVSKITGLSRDTLRFYDKIGLLKPEFTNPDNGYRYYGYDQFWTIDIINCCRKLDIPIPKIHEILESEDNDKVVELMMEHQKEALHLSNYFKQVAEDIEWYSAKHEQIKEAQMKPEITLRHLPEKRVIYATNEEDTRAYHVKLIQVYQGMSSHGDSFRRNYGFILDKERFVQGEFQKIGEYVEFMGEISEADDISAENYLTLPAGVYASCVINVVNNKADMTSIFHWLERERYEPEMIVAEEIGLQLFEYVEKSWPCEIKILLSEKKI